MTRTDWGEGFTYTGPLDAEYYSSRPDLSALIELRLSALDDSIRENSWELTHYYGEGLKPMAEALRLTGQPGQAADLEGIIEKSMTMLF